MCAMHRYINITIW